MLPAALALLLLTSTAAAQPSQLNKTDDVVQKAIAAMGGIDRIHAIHSLVYRGFHYEGSYKQEYVGSKTSP